MNGDTLSSLDQAAYMYTVEKSAVSEAASGMMERSMNAALSDSRAAACEVRHRGEMVRRGDEDVLRPDQTTRRPGLGPGLGFPLIG